MSVRDLGATLTYEFIGGLPTILPIAGIRLMP